MNLEARKYQTSALNRIYENHNTSDSRIVLAAATGSGKTEMSIMVINNFLFKNSGRILVVTHNTHVIKENYIDRIDELDVDFTHSTTDVNVDVFITLRQNLDNINFEDYDLMIVDEAHHNYFANTMKNFRKIKHQVLLTATPSKFVADGGFDIIPIGRLDIPNEFFSKLSFLCINSDNNVTVDDLNNVSNLNSNYNFKNDELFNIISSVIPNLGDGKKLFIFRNIKDARKGSKILKLHFGINAPTSDSKSDPDGLLVRDFKANGLDALCVVDRMRLGYSDDFLYYTIDMTFSHNADVVYQMMSRSNRGSQDMKKYYIKVTNNELNEYTRLVVSIALALFKSENVAKYNGKDFKGILIPTSYEPSKYNDIPIKGTNKRYLSLPDVLDDITTFFENVDYEDGDKVLRTLLGKQYKIHWVKSEVIKLSDGMLHSKFCSKYPGAYNHAYKHVYVDELKSFGRRNNWTKENVIELSNGMTYLEFRREYTTAYNHAHKNGYLNELNISRKLHTKWTKEEVVELSEHMNFSEFFKKYRGAYNHAHRNGYISELKYKRLRKLNK